MNTTIGGRLMAIGVIALAAGLSGLLYTHIQIQRWERFAAGRNLSAITDNMAGRPRNPDNFKTADEKYGGYRVASYVVGGAGLVFLAVGWSMGAGQRKPE